MDSIPTRTMPTIGPLSSALLPKSCDIWASLTSMSLPSPLALPLPLPSKIPVPLCFLSPAAQFSPLWEEITELGWPSTFVSQPQLGNCGHPAILFFLLCPPPTLFNCSVKLSLLPTYVASFLLTDSPLTVCPIHPSPLPHSQSYPPSLHFLNGQDVRQPFCL